MKDIPMVAPPPSLLEIQTVMYQEATADLYDTIDALRNCEDPTNVACGKPRAAWFRELEAVLRRLGINRRPPIRKRTPR